MKSKCFCLLYVLVFSVLLSCRTTNIFDNSIPADKTVTLAIDPAWTVKYYNRTEVKLKVKLFGAGFTGFTIPAGNTELIMDLYSLPIAKIIYTAKNVRLNFNFETGSEYYIAFRVLPLNDDGTVKKGWGTGSPCLVIYKGISQKSDDILYVLDVSSIPSGIILE
jgi:hypothetical protein